MKRRMIRLTAVALLFAFLLPLSSGFAAISETSSGAESEELPRVNIYTDSKKPVTKKEYEGATMSIELTDRYADYKNVYTTDSGGDIEIRCRGNSTYETSDSRLGDSGKFSYKIKLETKENMLGIGKSKHWVLIANYYDTTNLRNKLTYDLSGAMGLAYTQSRWVVVYLNGEYQGLYTLCESIRIEGDRVDITDWEDRAETVAKTIALKENLSKSAADTLENAMQNDLSWITTGVFHNYKISDYIDISDVDITSGYLLEYDMRQDGDTSKFTTGMGVKIQMDSPTALDTNPEMFRYVQGLISDMEEAFTSETFCTNEGVHYSEFVDMESLIDYFMIFHLFKNIEFGWLSIFLYIEDGIIYFGPCWDFDGSSGNQVTLYEDWMNPEQWFYMGGRAEWWKELCGDPYFVTQVEERWQEIKPLLSLYMESLPLWKEYIGDEARANFAHFGAPKNWYIGGSCQSFDSEYQILVNWLNRRIAWLDRQWSMRDPNIEGRGLESSEKITMQVTYGDGSALAPDLLTVSGAASDLLYDLSRKDNLQLTVSTLHTTHRKMLIYVNGKLAAQNALDMNTPATVSIPRSMLNTEPGAVNVIYMVGINHENHYYRASYVSVRMAEEVPSEGQCVLRVGDDYIVADKGETVTLPKIDVHADGFKALGWTDGNVMYNSGAEIKAEKSGYYWIDWKRTDLLTEFILEEGAAEEPTPTPGPEPKPETTPTTTVTVPATDPATTTSAVQTSATTTTTAQSPATTPASNTTAVTSVVTPAQTTSAPILTSTPTTSADLSADSNQADDEDGGLWKPLVAVSILAVAAVIVAVLWRKKKK